jgi:hypothetical protein
MSVPRGDVLFRFDLPCSTGLRPKDQWQRASLLPGSPRRLAVSLFKDLFDFRHAALQVGVVIRLDCRRDVVEGRRGATTRRDQVGRRDLYVWRGGLDHRVTPTFGQWHPGRQASSDGYAKNQRRRGTAAAPDCRSLGESSPPIALQVEKLDRSTCWAWTSRPRPPTDRQAPRCPITFD